VILFYISEDKRGWVCIIFSQTVQAGFQNTRQLVSRRDPKWNWSTEGWMAERQSCHRLIHSIDWLNKNKAKASVELHFSWAMSSGKPKLARLPMYVNEDSFCLCGVICDVLERTFPSGLPFLGTDWQTNWHFDSLTWQAGRRTEGRAGRECDR
jgi:hypothetical protein